MTQLILFTDIDGVLVDAEERLEPVQAVIARLQAEGVPVVLCSGRSKAAQKLVRRALKIQAPYIVENGSAIVIPGTSPIAYSHIGRRTQILKLGIAMDDLRDRLAAIRTETGLDFQGMMDMETTAVAEILGLPPATAAALQQREYSETILTEFSASDATIFQQACQQHDLQAVSGGRFFTVTGAGVDKGQAVAMLIKQFKAHYGEVRTAAVGDSPNDASMLNAVDEGYLVQHRAGGWHAVAADAATRLEAIGTAGFVRAVEAMLNG